MALDCSITEPVDVQSSESLMLKYQQMLADEEIFGKVLAKLSDPSLDEQGVSIHGLLVLLDMVVDMLAQLGLQNLKYVYAAVKKHPSVHFDTSMTWQTCHLSGMSARGCIKVGECVYVHRQHKKWVLCVWLSTHMREMERTRSKVPAADASTYRSALLCVLEQLQGAYDHVMTHFKKKNVLA